MARGFGHSSVYGIGVRALAKIPATAAVVEVAKVVVISLLVRIQHSIAPSRTVDSTGLSFRHSVVSVVDEVAVVVMLLQTKHPGQR